VHWELHKSWQREYGLVSDIGICYELTTGSLDRHGLVLTLLVRQQEAGASIPPNTLEQGLPLPLPLPPPIPSPSRPIPFPPLRSRPALLRLGGLGSALAPQRVRYLVNFRLKNLSSSSNDLQELFRK